MKAYQISALVFAVVSTGASALPQAPRFTSKYPQHPVNLGYGNDYPKYWEGQGYDPSMYPPQPQQVHPVYHPYPYSQAWTPAHGPAPAPAPPVQEAPRYKPPHYLPNQKSPAKEAIAAYSTPADADGQAQAPEAAAEPAAPPPAGPNMVREQHGGKSMKIAGEGAEGDAAAYTKVSNPSNTAKKEQVETEDGAAWDRFSYGVVTDTLVASEPAAAQGERKTGAMGRVQKMLGAEKWHEKRELEKREDQWPEHIKDKAERMMKSAATMQERGNQRMEEDNKKKEVAPADDGPNDQARKKVPEPGDKPLPGPKGKPAANKVPQQPQSKSRKDADPMMKNDLPQGGGTKHPKKPKQARPEPEEPYKKPKPAHGNKGRVQANSPDQTRGKPVGKAAAPAPAKKPSSPKGGLSQGGAGKKAQPAPKQAPAPAAAKKPSSPKGGLSQGGAGKKAQPAPKQAAPKTGSGMAKKPRQKRPNRFQNPHQKRDALPEAENDLIASVKDERRKKMQFGGSGGQGAQKGGSGGSGRPGGGRAGGSATGKAGGGRIRPNIDQGKNQEKAKNQDQSQSPKKQKKKEVEKVEKLVKRTVEVIGDYEYEYNNDCGNGADAIQELAVPSEGLQKRQIMTNRRVLPCGAPVTIRRVLGAGEPARSAVTIVPQAPVQHAAAPAPAPAPVRHAPAPVAQHEGQQQVYNPVAHQIADGQVQFLPMTGFDNLPVPAPAQNIPAHAEQVPAQQVQQQVQQHVQAAPAQTIERFIPGPAQTIEKFIPGPGFTKIVEVEKVVQAPAVTKVVEIERAIPGPVVTQIVTQVLTQTAERVIENIKPEVRYKTEVVHDTVVKNYPVTETVAPPPPVTRTVQLPPAIETKFQTMLNTVVNTVVQSVSVSVPGPVETQLVERRPVMGTKEVTSYESVTTPVEIESEIEVITKTETTKCVLVCPKCSQCEEQCSCGTFKQCQSGDGDCDPDAQVQMGSGVSQVPRTAKDLEAFFRSKLPDEFARRLLKKRSKSEERKLVAAKA